MFGLRSCLYHGPIRCMQAVNKRFLSQPAASHFRISNNSKKASQNVLLQGAKKKKGIRDILGDNLKSPSAPLSAPSPLVHLPTKA